MRRTLSCVLMMTLLLTACGGGQGETAEELAHRVREEYAALAGWSGTMEVTADYGNTVYDFTLDVVWRREGDTVLTVTAPDIIAGITARVGPEGAFLEYDGASLGTGPLTGDGLSPLEAIPFFMGELRSGWMASCELQQEGEAARLRLVYRDPNLAEGEGTECALYFEPDSRDLTGAELFWKGMRVLHIRRTDFTKEANDHDTGDSQDLG